MSDQPPEQPKPVSTLPPDEVTDRFLSPEPVVRRRLRRSDRATWFGDPPRRPLAAGHVVVITVMALVLAAFLNARGLHKTAQIQEPGWQRTIALNATGVLDTVSGWLLLDQPRSMIQSVAGRSGDDEIDTAIALPPPPRPVARGNHPHNTKATPPPPPKAYGPHNKLRVWVAGDSLSIVPGLELDQLTSSNPVMTSLGVDGRISTGLERPDVYNWFTRIRQEVAERHPEAVVLSFGGNDDHSYMTGSTGPKYDAGSAFGSPQWVAEYRRRIGGVMDEVIQGGGDVFWVGLPITRDRGQSGRYQLINRYVRYEINERPGRAFYIDTYKLFQKPGGGYADYLPDSSGQLELMRQPDGVHFSAAGGVLVAKAVLAAFHRAYDLTSWRHRGTVTGPPANKPSG